MSKHSELIERLGRKWQALPAQGGGSIDADGNASSYITDDGMRPVNPDGPEAIAAIRDLEGVIPELIEIIDEGVSVDITDAELRSAHPEDQRFIKKTRSVLRRARLALGREG